MPKVHRGASTGLLRSHSRTSSTSKVGATLQFTQKEQPPPKVTDKPKKSGYGHDGIQTHGKGVARVASGQRVHSREQVQPHAAKRAPMYHSTKTTTTNGTKPKPGFTISSPGEEEEDEWISSESGAATPNNHHSDSESGESDDHMPDDALLHRLGSGAVSQTPVLLPRVETARPSDFGAAAASVKAAKPKPERPDLRAETRTPTLPPLKTEPTPPPIQQQIPAQNHRPSEPAMDDAPLIIEAQVPSPTIPSPRTPSKRQSTTRPPSTHSTRGEPHLRPHPLIRGQSYGHVVPTKQSPLEPLTVIPYTSMSTSPTGSSALDAGHISTSPSSIKTTTTSPASPDRGSSSQYRRTSVSSARSVATLPTHPNIRDSVNWSLGDRKRTLSTISQSSSSAALSSLVHLPTVTRPPSPQAISFFPPVNPHANIEGIHPLLPGPYLNNHLTVLARRTPIKESFDRVFRAKHLLG
ncbi:hypothetical protein Hypma_008042 [Hypsizygus marmoreus]|uniref:Uncharacterized protein n=1 Tax=Hypsizygus marmoreus TaxID=39966 RepID=A0A369JRL0_HYPMA|nr:hypothetical protein Hypma_008042 [Hypsizygus marmoreus]